jgi:transposase
MATERLPMGKTRDILRLRWSLGRSVRQTAASVGASVGAIGKTTTRARAAGLDWAAVEQLDDGALERRLYGPRRPPPGPTRPEPDPVGMHLELKRPGVTLELLHLEYLEQHPDGLQYTAFCDRYRRWKKRRGLTMRQTHKAGERMFVDFSGKRPCIVDQGTGEVTVVELFVAVLGASSKTYAEATRTQQLPDWIAVHTRAVEYFGGSARVWTPDQLRSAVRRPDKHEPWIQRTYRDQAQHYGAVVIPARPGRARDKAKVEVGVQVAQRWILARLRNETFFSLEELNVRIAELLEELNQRPRRHLGGVSRNDLFERTERATLLPLPQTRFVHHDWKKAKVNLDYHVEVDFHWYSVPHTLVGEHVEVCFSATSVEILHLNKVIARHARSYEKYKPTTKSEHRPANHQAWADRDPGGLLRWATEVGPCTESMMRRIFESNPHRDQTWRSGRALRRVGEKYGPERMEVACQRALRFGARSYKPIERMLKQELDLRPHPDDLVDEAEPIHHNQVRGPGYYLH